MPRSIIRKSIECSQTSTAITFILHELAKNPEVQDRVLQEIQTVMGNRKSPAFEDIQKMTLLRGCVQETLRYSTLGYWLLFVSYKIQVWPIVWVL